MPSTKPRDTPFQKSHEREYALAVTARDLKGVVDTVQCLFCVYKGRETREGPTVKRRRTEKRNHSVQNSIANITNSNTRWHGMTTNNYLLSIRRHFLTRIRRA